MNRLWYINYLLHCSADLYAERWQDIHCLFDQLIYLQEETQPGKYIDKFEVWGFHGAEDLSEVLLYDAVYCGRIPTPQSSVLSLFHICVILQHYKTSWKLQISNLLPHSYINSPENSDNLEFMLKTISLLIVDKILYSWEGHPVFSLSQEPQTKLYTNSLEISTVYICVSHFTLPGSNASEIFAAGAWSWPLTSI
jgi:hypothetical protein